MYAQLLYFIIALTLFTIQQPGSTAPFPPLETLLLGLAFFLSFIFACHQAFRPLKRALQLDLPLSAITPRYHRVQTQLSILALFVLAGYIYVLNIKFHLRGFPGFDESLTLSGFIGLGLYLLHLCVIWTLSYPFHKRIHRSQISRAAFLKGHLSFASALLIPWVLISLLSDVMELLSLPAFFDTSAGQFVLLAGTLIVFVLFAPWLVVRLWGAQPMPTTPAREELETFCREHRFKVGGFMFWPLLGGEILTAGVMGILPKLRYIMITKGLLALLDMEEIKAVVAHEMGHVRRYHVLFYILFFLCFAMFTYSLDRVVLLILVQSDTLLEWTLAPDSYRRTLFSVAYSMPLLLMLVVYFRYVFGFFLRNSERQADLYALQLIGHPYTLISSLEKIGLFSGHIRDLPNWHHFSIRQRVEFLLQSHTNRSLIKRHNQKLYGAALAFLVVMSGLIYAGPNLADTQVMKQWQTELQVNLIDRELDRSPNDPDLHASYGGLLIEMGRFERAESVLLKAYQLAPRDATVLNNLAWFYATSPPPHKNPAEALRLALEAAAIEPKPHILDTLAEAYYANQRYEEALDTIRRALDQQPKNRSYYIEQLEKFEKARENGRAAS